MHVKRGHSLIKVAEDFSSDVLSSGLLVVHDTGGCCENEETELTRWQELVYPFFDFSDSDVEAR